MVVNINIFLNVLKLEIYDIANACVHTHTHTHLHLADAFVTIVTIRMLVVYMYSC